MSFLITLFYLSLITIVAMVGLKLVSLRRVKVSVITGTVEKELHSHSYEVARGLWHTFRTNYLVKARVFILALFYTVAQKVLRFNAKLIHKVQAKHGKWYDMVKGKGTLKKKGSVSFFLRDVAEYKKTMKSDSL